MDTEVAPCCTHPACILVAVNKAGLTIHTSHEHILPIKFMCQFYKQVFHCILVAVNKAGLTIHTSHEHILPIKFMCQFYKQVFHRQGLHNHQRLQKRSRST